MEKISLWYKSLSFRSWDRGDASRTVTESSSVSSLPTSTKHLIINGGLVGAVWSQIPFEVFSIPLSCLCFLKKDIFTKILKVNALVLVAFLVLSPDTPDPLEEHGQEAGVWSNSFTADKKICADTKHILLYSPSNYPSQSQRHLPSRFIPYCPALHLACVYDSLHE